jgi:hypothetical protein
MLRDFYDQHRRAIFIGIITLTVIIIGAILFYTFFVFHITSITPDPRGASYLTPRLVVQLNKNIKKDSIKVVSKSGLNLETEVKDSTLTINILTSMKVNERYTITIESLSSESGDEIKNHDITLVTTKNGALNEEDEKIVLDRQQANKPDFFKDPILKYLPHSTLDYSIISKIYYVGTKDQKISIIITLELSAADVRTNRDAAIQQYKQEAMNYLSSLEGVDLSKYEIEVKVDASSL